ncbi:MAG: molecular chaperone DnaJ [Prevotella sp.]|nr:molecular chaperone DnaJ [Prevotella sp.]
MAKRDYYDVLGVAKTATDAEIKAAYRKIAIKYHPDRQTDKSEAEKKDAEEKFKEAAEAYSVLSDATKRKQYDQFGFDGPGMGSGFGNGFGGASGFSMDDIFSRFGDIFGGHRDFGDIFGSGFSSRGGQGRRVYKGNDLRIKVKLTLEDIATGVTKRLKVRKDVVCTHCGGSGSADGSGAETCRTCSGSGVVYRTQQSVFGVMRTQTNCPACGGEGTIIKNKCRACGGSGVVKGEEIIEVNIPAGVGEGMVINVQGKGNAGPRRGINGDIQVYIEEEPHPTFIRDEQDLIYNLLLDFPTAALGGQVRIPTIGGREVKISIEPGTQPGKTLRLRGKGLPAVKGYGSGTGDLLVNVSVYVPKTLTREERMAIEGLRGKSNFTGDRETKKTIFDRFRNYF